jgi:hypothetical protein
MVEIIFYDVVDEICGIRQFMRTQFHLFVHDVALIYDLMYFRTTSYMSYWNWVIY